MRTGADLTIGAYSIRKAMDMKKCFLIMLCMIILSFFPVYAESITLNWSALNTENDEVTENTSETADEASRLCVDIGFYLNGAAPGDRLDEALIHQVLNTIKPFAHTLRLYASSDELAKVYPLAHADGFDIIAGAWLSGNETDDRKELDALIEHCRSGYATTACVGSETLLRGDLDAKTLAGYIQYVRDALEEYDITITTADEISYLMKYPEIADSCDILFVNYYPYWSGIDIVNALPALDTAVRSLQNQYPDKKVMISETGYPTDGTGLSGELTDSETAALYYSQVFEWSRQTGIEVCYFECIDESWKASAEGAPGAHWGFLNSDLTVKDCYLNTPVFKGIYN